MASQTGKQFVLIMEITSLSFQIAAGSCTSWKVKTGCRTVRLGEGAGGVLASAWQSPTLRVGVEGEPNTQVQGKAGDAEGLLKGHGAPGHGERSLASGLL